jgi:nitroreductase
MSTKEFITKVLRRILRPARKHVLRLGARHVFWARLYYMIFSSDFGREQMIFLAGIQAYNQSLDTPVGTMALLRRNIHRLEKGLIMRPRRTPFATSYIEETVRAFEAFSNTVTQNNCSELTWARDVLAEYFSVNRGAEEVEPARKLFEAIPQRQKSAPPADPTREPLIPFKRTPSQIPSTEDLENLAKRRRSVRWFLQEPVDRRLIDRALEIAAQSPSACNRQPFEFRIFDEQEIVKKIVEFPGGLAGYSHNVPVVVVVVGQQRHYFHERDRHLIYIDSSLAIMSFLYGLEVQGLSSCCVNWAHDGPREKEFAEFLHLKPDERPVMLIALGHPDPEGLVPRSAKKPLTVLRRYNFEESHGD